MHPQARLEARISLKQKRMFQQAAEVQGRTLTEFIISCVQEVANRVLEERNLLDLSVRDRAMFIDSLTNPAAPNEKLRSAYEHYKQSIQQP
jgi:uncharacterized protein (DUF1778 family)